MEKSFRFSLCASDCEEQDEVSSSKCEEQGQDEISGSEITDHDDKPELCDHINVCEPCEGMEVCDSTPVLINDIGEIISMVRSDTQNDTSRIISIDNNKDTTISMTLSVTEQDHENIQNADTRRESLENEVITGENDNVILETNSTMIINAG